MTIVRVTREILDERLHDLIALSDEFLESLGNPKSRTHAEKRGILLGMVEAPQTVILMMAGENDTPIGLCYYNRGTGYSCGGEYLWINGVYIREQFRGREYGPAFLRYVENDAAESGAKLIVSSRDLDNRNSGRMFEKRSFLQNDQVSIKKEDL